jgi:hypothetical protein
MILYTFGGGRLGNQLVRFAHWLAWTLEHEGKVGVVDAGFWRYAHHFEYWSTRRGCGFPRTPGWARLASGLLGGVPSRWEDRIEQRGLRFLHALGGWLPGWQRIGKLDTLAELDLDDTGLLEQTARARVTACAGWRIASWALFAKHEGEIRRLLAPRADLLGRCGAFVQGQRGRADLVLGVQIRHGDYRRWWDGRFYFPTPRYVAWMRQWAALHRGRRVAFVVTSDEYQDPAQFDGLDVAFAPGSVNAGGPAAEALFTLAACDAILAPPSTFAAWASHWGRVPWWPVGGPSGQDDAWAPVPGDLDAARRHPYLALVVA